VDARISELNEHIARESQFVRALRDQMARVIVGQTQLIDRLILALLANGHVLLEGVPGLAKTLAVRTLAGAIDTGFQRLQFTPDLLPADIVGTMVYDERSRDFFVKKGPIFSNLILADEINRAPAKVQSALLEAMQERQVTIGGETFRLDEPFLVLATQNPIEQEGTYPLPEAQVDRFMLKVQVGYPDRSEELGILRRWAGAEGPRPQIVCEPGDILRARQVVHEIYMDERIEQYIVDLVCATRDPRGAAQEARTRLRARVDLTLEQRRAWEESIQTLENCDALIDYGASPRATIYLAVTARAHAFMEGRGYVVPDDVLAVGPDVLRHRILLSYEAEAEGLTSEDLVDRIFKTVESP
jgi:MoxR-like ATPase